MAKNLHPPEKLLLCGNLKDNFRKFKQQFDIYITAAGIKDKTEDIKWATLLHVIGPEAVEIFSTFKWNEGDNPGDDKKVEKVLGKYEKYCSPKSNSTYERHHFSIRNQNEGESIDSYVTDLRILSKSCEFGDLTDSLIKDRLVFEVKQDTVRSRVNRETDLTLQKGTDIRRAAGTSTQQGIITEGNVDIVRKKVFKNKPSKRAKNKAVTSQIYGKYGYKHEPRKCPAFGKICKNYNKRNHFAKKCKSKKMHEVQEVAMTFS